MTATAMLIKEIETMPEEAVQETLDFVLFLRTKKGIIEVFPKMKTKKMPHSIGIDMSGFKFNREEANVR